MACGIRAGDRDVRVDMPEAWLTVEASGIDAEELEAQLRQVQPLQAGSETFRTLRLLS
jgi:hypothetical protein